jgi:hypothetical protein
MEQRDKGQYKYKAIPTLYKGVQYRSRLEAKWAAFFDIIGWGFAYEPFDLEGWWPDFKIVTNVGSSFLVEVKPISLMDIQLRLKLARATDYAEGILIVGESPFGTGKISKKEEWHIDIDVSGIPQEWLPTEPPTVSVKTPNCIGMASVWGAIKNPKEQNDFEFCIAVVMNRYGAGNDIFNLCTAPFDVLDRYDTEQEFCLPIWNEAVNRVQALKPK